MSTRGFIGFAVDGEVKVAYNHYDSYPDSFGLTVLNWLREGLAADGGGVALAESARSLRVAAPDSSPSPEDVERFRHLSWTAAEHGGPADLRKGQQWYDLLHETMGRPGLMLEAGVIEDGSGFPANSLFAEWGYVADFDKQQLEVYEGFQRSPHSDGRFASDTPDDRGYYPVRMVKSWPFGELPSDRDFEDAFTAEEDE